MLEAIYWGGLGLIFGSFTNVLVLRFGHKTLMGRSACPHCHRTLEWYELVPVISWVLLRGKCRTCAYPISWQYPFVEAMTGLLVLAVGISPVALLLKILAIPIVILGVAITVYDLRYMLIPDAWAYTLAIVGFAYGILTFVPVDLKSLMYFLVSGPAVALPLAALHYVSQGRWMGLGDAKLILGPGWMLGILPGVVTLWIAFTIGAIVSVFVLIPLQYLLRGLARSGITQLRQAGPALTMHSEVPFGPFLTIAVCIVWISGLYHLDIPGYLLLFLSLN